MTALSLIAILLSLSINALACGGGIGWTQPGPEIPSMTLERAILLSKEKFAVEVSKSPTQSKCSEADEYDVIDSATKKYLGSVPVATYDGRYLFARVIQLMQTPKSQLIDLQSAYARFREDVAGLEADLGVGAYIPSIMPIEDRTTNMGANTILYVDIKTSCQRKQSREGKEYVWREMPHLLENNVEVKTMEYIPGRVDYAPQTIYQSGDLRKAILNNKELYREMFWKYSVNINVCPEDNTYGDGKEFWVAAFALLSDKSEALKTGPERFLEVTGTPVSAYMLNANKISVVYDQNFEKEFGGTIAEILEIQKALSGVKIDKRSKLDYHGSFIFRYPKENWPIPVTLQE